MSIVPLSFVGFTLFGLWLLGKYIAKTQNDLTFQDMRQPHRGVEIFRGLHVHGLQDRDIVRLKRILREKAEPTLTEFIAFRNPLFIEIDDYIRSIRERFQKILSKPGDQASLAEKKAAIKQLTFHDQPNGLNFNILSRTKILHLCECNLRKRQAISYEFINRFGGEAFMSNFGTYNEFSGETDITIHIPVQHPQRSQLESLAKCGVALQGRGIPIKQRLNVLKFKQLIEMAQELNIPQEIKSKEEVIDAVSAKPGSAILLAMIYSIDDIFFIPKLELDLQTIEHEWTAICSYAVLLCSNQLQAI